MVKANGSVSPSFQKYGVPLYGVSWVALHKFSPALSEPDLHPGDHHLSSVELQPSDELSIADNYLVCAGGGGEGRSGISNAVILCRFDFISNSLSDHPVENLRFGPDLPYRMAVHPIGEGIICAFPKCCKWLEWVAVKCSDMYKIGIKLSEKKLTQLEDIGQQLAVTFNSDGSLLAVGGEDGRLRVLKWPALEIVLDQDDVYTSVKDLTFSPDAKFLVSLGSGGPCRVWDLSLSIVVASLQKEKDEVFGFCRFSSNQVLYTTLLKAHGGCVVMWNTTSWQRMNSKRVSFDPISAFNISDDGKHIAFGTIQGDISIIDYNTMRTHVKVRKAHLGIVTALSFSRDSRALVSVSMDSSVRVTLIVEKTKNGLKWIVMLFIILFAVFVAYFFRV